jgi:hypothetical protein
MTKLFLKNNKLDDMLKCCNVKSLFIPIILIQEPARIRTKIEMMAKDVIMQIMSMGIWIIGLTFVSSLWPGAPITVTYFSSLIAYL